MSDSNSGLISRQDVLHTLNAYSELLKTSGKYYRKLLEVSQAGAEFASMLEAMGKCKGAEQSGTGLKAAAELHRTIAKNQEQLAEAIHKDFELPLQRNFSAHQKRVDENEKTHEKSVRKIQEEISKTESKMLKGRKKDMTAFQQSLQDMQKLAQDLEKQRMENVEHILNDEQKNFMFLVQKAAGVVKSQYEHFSNLSSFSRDVTEEIISIAFAPPGKTLDAAEKKRVVDKFLGNPTANPAPNGDRQSNPPRASIASMVADDVRRGSVDSTHSSAGPAQRPPPPPVSINTPSNRPTTPPISPLPSAGGATTSRRSSNSTIQESLLRLNIAAAANQVSSISETESAITMTNEKSLEEMKKIDNSDIGLDLVIALHDFTARTERELSFKKNDILLVKQRQENWLYATHYGQQQQLLPSTGSSKSGWIPVSYTASFKQ